MKLIPFNLQKNVSGTGFSANQSNNFFMYKLKY